MGSIAGVEYTTIGELKGPLMIVEGVTGAAYDELVEIETVTGERRLGKVLEVGEGKAVVQVFEGTYGLSIEGTKARFLGRTMEIGVSADMLGRVFDGLGRPLDEMPDPVAEDYRDVNGEPINPERRAYPSDFIQTGISAIDGLNSLVRGQKLPIFSGAGLPHNMIAAQVARQATVPGKEEEFAVIFAAVGVKNDEARFFRQSLEESGALSRSALFLNLADDPAIERIVTPRVALTLAEHLAFWHDMHVLVIITDMSSYCESLREVSAAREEVPGRKGYPGYMYSVDGSRRVVVKDPSGLVKVVGIGELFRSLASRGSLHVSHDGMVERVGAEGWEALSYEGDGRATFKPIKHVVRHVYKGNMVRLVTWVGETVVTPNHSVFTVYDGKIVPTEAGKLKVGDTVAHGITVPEDGACIASYFTGSLMTGPSTLTHDPVLEVIRASAGVKDHYGLVNGLNAETKASNGGFTKRIYVKLNDVISTEIKSIEIVSPTERYVYDLVVEGTHNFVDACGGVLLHNTDLASIYERAGRIKGKKGSITQMPILTMPSDDITHPVPDLTGYITEGQIVLGRDLYRKGIYPPINQLMCLSRLMGPAIISEKKTREDHGDLEKQLKDAYAKSVQLRALVEIVGKSGLSPTDLKYLEFGDEFEKRFINQGYDENRSLEQTLELGWDVLAVLPESELTHVREEFVKKYYRKRIA